MMKRMTALGLCLVAAGFAQVDADSWNWDSCCWDGCWEAGAEALYWKPCTCEWAYGYDESNNVLSVSPDYHWGFRIFAGYEASDACGFLELDWTHLKGTDTNFVQGAQILIGNIPSSETRAREHLRYNRINFRGGYSLYRGCDVSFQMFAGLRYTDIDSNHHLRTEPAGDVVESSSFWGVGAEVGVAIEYGLGCNVYLLGHLAGSAAVGRREAHQQSVESQPRVTRTTSVPTRTQCVPGIDMRLGIGRLTQCGCLTLFGEIGYEFHHYFGVLAAFPPVFDGAAVVECADVGFGGPYASLRLRF
jgi:hypothetical protein